jgi:hypothetical protein
LVGGEKQNHGWADSLGNRLFLILVWLAHSVGSWGQSPPSYSPFIGAQKVCVAPEIQKHFQSFFKHGSEAVADNERTVDRNVGVTPRFEVSKPNDSIQFIFWFAAPGAAGEKICLSIYRRAGWQKAFGGKLLKQRRLRQKSRVFRTKKVGGS